MAFGSFDDICKNAPYPLCPLVGDKSTGLDGPACYARSLDFGMLIFQPSTLVMEIIAFFTTIVIIYMVKTKYTAVGRKEMLLFFYMYICEIIVEFFIISNILKSSSVAYLYFVALHNAFISAMVWSLLLNGFVGFQFAEDGTRLSLWTFRLSTFLVGGLVFLLSVLTFLDIGLKSSMPVAIFVIYYIFNPLCLLVYLCTQFVLVLYTLDEKWGLGNLLLGLIIFVVGQVLVAVSSSVICQGLGHYADGMFFGCIATLFAVMMVYKYWDTITKEDLEFSLGDNTNVWEVEELMHEKNSYDINDNNNFNDDEYISPDGFLAPTTRSVMNRSSLMHPDMKF